ncbi:MAG: N-acetylglucosamine related transporter NagX [Chitinophagaceae bacterium]|nr:N-acetylglucosamine related transporter NagX [Chitinophagaceae bacterium]
MTQRYYSLDVFRGATVALMILVNNPGSWAHIYSPLEHAAWHGCTPTDLVFPFFLFAVGNALSFVMPRFENAGTSVFLKKVLKRTALIILIGLFLNWSPFIAWQNNHLVAKPWTNVRIMGVLQRIALCYCFGAFIIYFFKPKGAFVIGGIILLVYWFICFWLGSAGDPNSLPGYFGTNVDINLFGVSHVYKGEGIPFDPEGLGSTAPAIVQVIFGFLVGQYIQQKGKSYEMLTNLFVAAMVLIFAGFCWDKIFPINKKIWSSSYVLYTTGLAMAVLSVIIYIIEFKNERSWWMRFFDVFGKNALFIFFISGFLPRLLGLIRIFSRNDALTGKPVYTSPFGWFYENICKPISSDLKVGSLFYAICMIVFYWLIVYILDRKKIYIKV